MLLSAFIHCNLLSNLLKCLGLAELISTRTCYQCRLIHYSDFIKIKTMQNNIFSIAGKNYQQLTPLFLRLAVGFGFMAHGWAKLSRGTAGFEKLLVLTGVPLPHVNAYVVPVIEVLGGIAIFIGAITIIAAIPLIGTMLVAMMTIQLKFGYSSVKTIGLSASGPIFGPPGYEINLLYIAALVALMCSGPGLLSVDQWLARKKQKVSR